MPLHNKISKAEFDAKLNSGYPHTGLVEDIGYVEWTTEDIYFVKLYPFRTIKNVTEYYNKPVDSSKTGVLGNSLKPYYQQIQVHEQFKYIRQNFEVVTKKKYNIKVTPPEVLIFTDERLALSYYDGVLPSRNDNISAPSKSMSDMEIKRDLSLLDKAINQLRPIYPLAKVGETVDDQIGLPLGIADKFAPKGSKVPVIGNVLTGLSIVSDVVEGDYYSAGGKLIKSVAGWYGVAWDVGVGMYQSDLMQKRLAIMNAKGYKEALQRYELARRRRDYRAADKAFEDVLNYYKMFEGNMDNLGIKYRK